MNRTLSVIISIFFFTAIFAQQDPQMSHYMFMTSFYNPANAGIRGNVSINLLNRNQWMKFEGAPKTNFLTVDAPLSIAGSQFGLGAKMMSDNYAFVNDMLFGIFLSKYISLPVGRLSIGLSTNAFTKQFDAQWQFPDQQEALFTGQVRSMVLDLDFGLMYVQDNFYAGFSMTHITAPDMKFLTQSGTQQVALVRHYYFTSAYNISVAGMPLDITPSFLAKSDGRVIQLDLNLNILYNKKIWAGVSYRNGESIIGFIGTSYIKDIRIGLSYDALINSIGRASSGSFEVYIGYNFSILKMEKPQHYHNVKTL